MSFLRYLFALAAIHAGLAAAATRTWPGAAPCNGTLQACIDAAADDDRIEITTETPITDSVAMRGRRLTLAAADGYQPRFLGAGVLADDAGGGTNITLRLSRLRFDNGWVMLNNYGSGTATVDLRELVLTRAPGATGNGIRIVANGGTVEAMLYDNRISGLPASLNDGLVTFAARGGMLDASAYYNHIASTGSGDWVDGAGILVDYAGAGSGGTVKLHGNEVRGSFARAGIFLSEGLFSSTAVSFDARVYSNVVVGNGGDGGTGISLVPNNGHIDVQLINNTVTRVRTGILASNWDGATTPQVDGLVKNNLVRAERALYLNAGIATGLDNDYNLLNGTTLNLTPGAHTITAPAALVSDEYPRLSAASPAIDAADGSTLGLGLIFNALPVTDADGLRRFKREGADIGAYEWGDMGFLHTANSSNVGGHISWFADAAVDGTPSADLFVTPNFNAGSVPGGTAYDHPFGTWYSGGEWSVFNQDTANAMPLGAHFNVFVPAPGSGVFRHRASADSISGWTSRLDDGSVNNLPDRIVLATQNFSAGGAYNAHPIGVFYLAFGGPGSWFLANIDLADSGAIPVGAGFSVYAQEASPNAFRVAATPANRPGSATLYLDHPLLDGTPCARPIVTRLFDGTAVAGHYDVAYTSDGHWTIFAYEGMPLGTEFNVLVDPAQVFACRDRIFADGFD